MKVFLVALGLFFFSIFPGNLYANGCGCAPTNGASNNHRATLVEIQGSPPSVIRDGILAGTEIWNECNQGGDDWPYFFDQHSAPEDTLTFRYDSGMSTQGCAQLDMGTNEVTLFATYDSPSDPPIDCDHSSLAVAQSVAHEVGHYFGLGENPDCDQAIMGDVRYTPGGLLMTNYDLTAAEKAKADSLNANELEEWIEECQEQQNCGGQTSGQGSPILLDLDGGGFRLSGLSDPVFFDIDQDFALEAMAWTARGSGDGFLFRNRYRTPGVDNGTELFGDATRSLLTGERAANGYEALAEFDLADFGGNENGWIDPGDAFFRSLGVWIDRDHDAVSQEEEMYSLDELGILRLGLRYRESPRVDRHGNELRYWSRAWRQTSQGARPLWTVDVFFVLEQDP